MPEWSMVVAAEGSLICLVTIFSTIGYANTFASYFYRRKELLSRIEEIFGGANLTSHPLFPERERERETLTVGDRFYFKERKNMDS